MKLGDLSEQLTALGDLVILWFDCLRQPFVTIRKAMVDYPDDKGRLRYAVKLWMVSFLIGLVLQLPMYQLLGMGWQKAGFLLPSALVTLLSFLALGISIHLALKANRVNSDVVKTCLIYAVVFSAHAPFFTLLTYPRLVDTLVILQSAKEQQDGILNAMIEVFSQIQAAMIGTAERSTAGLVGDAITMPVVYLYSGTVIIMFLHALRVMYEAPKYSVFLGTSLAMGALVIVPIVGLSAIYWLVMYLAL